MSSCTTFTSTGLVLSSSSSVNTAFLTVTDPGQTTTSVIPGTVCPPQPLICVNTTCPLTCTPALPSTAVVTLPGAVRVSTILSTDIVTVTRTVVEGYSTLCTTFAVPPTAAPVVSPTPNNPQPTPSTPASPTPDPAPSRTAAGASESPTAAPAALKPSASIVTVFTTSYLTTTNGQGVVSVLTSSMGIASYVNSTADHSGSSSSTPVGSIVGGVIGGLFGLLFLVVLFEGLRRKGVICAGAGDEGLDEAVWDPSNHSPSVATMAGSAGYGEKEELAGSPGSGRPKSAAFSTTSSSNYHGGEMRALSPGGEYVDNRRSIHDSALPYLAAGAAGGAALANRQSHHSGYDDHYGPPSQNYHANLSPSQQQQQYLPRVSPPIPQQSYSTAPSASSDYYSLNRADSGSGQTHATSGSADGHLRAFASAPMDHDRSVPVSRTNSVRSIVEPSQTFGRLRVTNMDTTEEEA